MAKGGGAWKVAYADFVTAMMAFFLVMWICGQDQKMKTEISRYFNNPMGIKPLKESPFPNERGNLFNTPNKGEVAGEKKVDLGMGRESYSNPMESSPSTKLVGDYLFAEEGQFEFWEEQAQEELSKAKRNRPGKKLDAEREAVARVAEKLKSDFIKKMPSEINGVYRDLLINAVKDVNFQEIAEDIVRK